MSQDTGLWSVRRPRETLGGISLNSSGIPQAALPPSAMKRSSLAPGGPGSSSHHNSNINNNNHGRSMSGSRQSLALPRPGQPLFQPLSSGAGAGSSLGVAGDLGLSSVKRASFQMNNTSSFKPFTPGGVGSMGGIGGIGGMGGGMGGIGSGGGRASTDSGDRRSSSVYRSRPSTNSHLGGHQSFFQQAPQAAGVPRDPRPLKDRGYQTRIGQELLEYLAQHNFEMDMKHALSPNTIKSPTQKDFNYMFQWLYRRIDPSYRFQKNIDQEVPPLLKQLRYPYERGITKSQIAAVGGQNWSTFLGLLHWMMQLAQMLERYGRNAYDDACVEAGIDVAGDHITFDFLSAAYRDWLAMDDDAADDDVERVLAPHVEAMARAFQRSNARYEQELEILEAEHARLAQDVQDLEKATPDPQVLDNHFKIMEEDRVKFEEYNALAAQRSEKYEGRARVLQDELDRLAAELRDAEDERRALQKAVDDQGISMQDIDRMTSERERLQRGIEAAAQRLDDVKRRVAEKEAEAARKLDELERLVDRYNALAYQIGLMPASAVNAKGKDYELQVLVNEGASGGSLTASQLQGSIGHGGVSGAAAADSSDRLLADAVTGYQPAHVLNLDLRGHVKSAFASLRKEISERRKVAMDAMMEDHDLLDRAKEAIEDKRSEVESLEHRVRAAEEEYERNKEVTTAQKLASDAQIEKMEKELAKMRAQLSESVQLMEQREMNTNIEYEQLTLRANSLREELHTETMRMLRDVINFKMHVQKSLEEYETFVADELEKELESKEMRDDNTQEMNM